MTKANSCPLCGNITDPAHKPFCSDGCRARDLLQWLGEGYRVPAGPADTADSSGLDSDADSG